MTIWHFVDKNVHNPSARILKVSIKKNVIFFLSLLNSSSAHHVFVNIKSLVQAKKNFLQNMSILVSKDPSWNTEPKNVEFIKLG